VIPEGFFFSDIPDSVQSILGQSVKKSDQTLVSLLFTEAEIVI
jgi:hypothetical protein